VDPTAALLTYYFFRVLTCFADKRITLQKLVHVQGEGCFIICTKYSK